MRNLQKTLTELLKSGYCSPKILNLSKSTKEPPATIHYNIRQMENEKLIKGYKAVFDYEKIDEGYCNYLLVNVASTKYANPESIGKRLSKIEHIESVDVISGGWELIVKVRTKDTNEYYEFVKSILAIEGIAKTTSLASLKQLKSEYIEF